ncbi:aldo/keto reductase [Chryseobacterium sp. ISL-6]|uniref:aldo/keto reductase n=1 Tax=Chryseobacterium sp. ISL-6 TaxID=2819143 RepID=UPI001BEAE896|nr:aldo/keto reductase [Chryseobacterium sp. ISL-6]MBT2623630.1 aldo/keto reductase [Chryseobacterium sp. ISL-6]
MVKIDDISKIGIGTYRMSANDLENNKTLQYAIDSGINLIDTASNYNFGTSEILIGNTIDKQIRNAVFIVSKAGYIQGQDIEKVKNNNLKHIELNENFLFSIDPDFISFQLENSLTRLNTDYIDCYLLHNPEYYFEKNISREDLKNMLFDSFLLLEQKVKKGKIRYYGISSNVFNSLPLKDILDSLGQFPHFKFLQFPYNIVERNLLFQLDNAATVTISQLKEKGLYILSNRPLNTTYENKVLRLIDFPNENMDFISNQEQELFDLFKSIITERLLSMQADATLENYYPINFFIENRLNIGNEEAINKAIYSYLVPFLDAVELKNEKTVKLLNDLRNYWIVFSKNNNQDRLNNLKDKLYTEGILSKSDNRDFSLILAENYLNSGVDTVLMGLTKNEYIDSIKNIL